MGDVLAVGAGAEGRVHRKPVRQSAELFGAALQEVAVPPVRPFLSNPQRVAHSCADLNRSAYRVATGRPANGSEKPPGARVGFENAHPSRGASQLHHARGQLARRREQLRRADHLHAGLQRCTHCLDVRIRRRGLEPRHVLGVQAGIAFVSLMLRKLGSYPRQNGLAVALRELGRIKRTLFILGLAAQRGVAPAELHAGLNEGEARNALARAVFFYRLGEIRDGSFERQRYRASGPNLVTAAIVLWNTVYLERAVAALHGYGQPVDENLLRYRSALGWGTST